MRKLLICVVAVAGCTDPTKTLTTDMASTQPTPDLASPADLASTQTSPDLTTSGPVFSCDQRTAPSASQYCTDFADITKMVADLGFKPLCQGTWAETGCSPTGSLGGCRTLAGDGSVATTTIWFYPDAANGFTTAAQVMGNCNQSGTLYVAP